MLKLGASGALKDGELLARYVESQDQVAFEELVRRHGPMVLRVCQRVLHHAHNAEDAFQATFIVLMRKAETLRQESVASWLYGVAYRVALEARSLASQRQAREKLSSEAFPHALLEDGRPSAADERAARELRHVLDEELSHLPEKYRAAVVLCYFEGKNAEEAALQLHCQAPALRQRLMRAREFLRSRLARRGLVVPAGLLTTLMAEEAKAAMPVSLASAVVGCSACGAPTAAAAGSRPLALAEAVLGDDLSRRCLLRWAAVLAVALLGAAGVALGVWSRPNSPEHAEKYEQRLAEAVRVFDSALPLLVFEDPGRHPKTLGSTPTPDGRGLRIPGQSRWLVSPRPPGDGVVMDHTVGGIRLSDIVTPHLNGPDLRAFVTEVRRQQIPGVAIYDVAFTDDDLAQLDDLPCLETLFLCSERISDAGLQRLQRLPGLRHLSVIAAGAPGNRVTGAGLAHFTGLERLTVDSLGIGDEFVDSLRGMSHLKELEVRRAGIGDAGWEKLAATQPLPRGLEHLRIEEGTIGPRGMAALQGLTGLKRLELYRDDIDDPVFQAIGAMSQLETLVVDCCGDGTVRGFLPATGNLGGPQLLRDTNEIKLIPLPVWGIHYLRPRGGITDRALAPLGRLSHLKELEIASDEVTEAGIPALAPLTNVRHLRLHGRQLSDSCLRHLGTFQELRCLDLVGTRAGSSAAVQLRGLAHLQVILVPWNSNEADCSAYRQALPGVTVIGPPYRGWYDVVEKAVRVSR
jgi:RNA polymerase sigma factor (sigma-70 family)